jgi:D-alanyl-lipoteichoic acid biosynthesis protein DltB
MIPYGGLFFFYILALVSLPAVVLGLLGKPIKKYGIVANLFMLFLLFSNSWIQSLCLLLFYVGELILIKGYLLLKPKIKSRWFLRLVVLFATIPLILVKFSHLFTTRQIGFLGISYVTFKCIQMLVEIYDGLIDKVNILDFTYFLLFFPTISSGPIDRSRRFMNDINQALPEEEYRGYLRAGLWKIFMGIGYKFIIAALISTYWMSKVPANHSLLNTLNYMYSYSMYLFFDFAGYSFIAVGTSYLFGIKTPDNFNKPFISKDIKDFWNRWHMSLSFWFRDFIYTRFVMLSLKKKWFKSRYTASYIGYLITMGTMGIWHGTEKYYIIYGLYHGLLIILTDYFERKSKWYKKVKNTKTWNVVSTVITFNLVCFGFLIFSGFLIK